MRRDAKRLHVDDRKLLKYIKKASKWCVTIWKSNVQKQHWFHTKQEAEEFMNNE